MSSSSIYAQHDASYLDLLYGYQEKVKANANTELNRKPTPENHLHLFDVNEAGEIIETTINAHAFAKLLSNFSHSVHLADTPDIDDQWAGALTAALKTKNLSGALSEFVGPGKEEGEIPARQVIAALKGKSDDYNSLAQSLTASLHVAKIHNENLSNCDILSLIQQTSANSELNHHFDNFNKPLSCTNFLSELSPLDNETLSRSLREIGGEALANELNDIQEAYFASNGSHYLHETPHVPGPYWAEMLQQVSSLNIQDAYAKLRPIINSGYYSEESEGRNQYHSGAGNLLGALALELSLRQDTPQAFIDDIAKLGPHTFSNTPPNHVALYASSIAKSKATETLENRYANNPETAKMKAALSLINFAETGNIISSAYNAEVSDLVNKLGDLRLEDGKEAERRFRKTLGQYLTLTTGQPQPAGMHADEVLHAAYRGHFNPSTLSNPSIDGPLLDCLARVYVNAIPDLTAESYDPDDFFSPHKQPLPHTEHLAAILNNPNLSKQSSEDILGRLQAYDEAVQEAKIRKPSLLDKTFEHCLAASSSLEQQITTACNFIEAKHHTKEELQKRAIVLLTLSNRVLNINSLHPQNAPIDASPIQQSLISTSNSILMSGKPQENTEKKKITFSPRP